MSSLSLSTHYACHFCPTVTLTSSDLWTHQQSMTWHGPLELGPDDGQEVVDKHPIELINFVYQIADTVNCESEADAADERPDPTILGRRRPAGVLARKAGDDPAQ